MDSRENTKWTCPSCGSQRWVPVSIDGGGTAIPQCVTCGERRVFINVAQRRADPEYIERLQRHINDNRAALDRLSEQ